MHVECVLPASLTAEGFAARLCDPRPMHIYQQPHCRGSERRNNLSEVVLRW